MKFTCDKAVLSAALRNAKKATTTTPNGGVAYQAVRITVEGSKAIFTATNMDMTVREVVEAKDATAGDILVTASTLVDFVSRMPNGNLTVSCNGKQLSLTAGAVVMNIDTIDIASAPVVIFPTASGVEIPASDFLTAIGQVSSAASKDQARQVLTGVLMEVTTDGLRLVATDSYRLAKREIQGASGLPEGTSIVAPAGPLSAAAEMLSGSDKVTVRLTSTAVSLEDGDRKVVLRLLSGAYPNYQMVLAVTNKTSAVIERNPFMEALNRARAAVTIGGSMATKMAFSPTDGTLALESGNAAREAMEVVINGEAINLAANAEYVFQALEKFDTDKVTLNFSDPVKPIQLTSDAGDLLYVVMPTRA